MVTKSFERALGETLRAAAIPVKRTSPLDESKIGKISDVAYQPRALSTHSRLSRVTEPNLHLLWSDKIAGCSIAVSSLCTCIVVVPASSSSNRQS